MGHFQDLLFLFLLGSSFLTMAEDLQCQKSVVVAIEEDPMNSFNWTAEEVETCVQGALCQESLVMITPAGDKTVIVATKGCISEETEAATFIQHSAPPGLVAVSYSNFCEESFCNEREDIISFWKQEEIAVPSVPQLQCPTCVALGTCSSAPSLPCPKGTTRCYQGKLHFSGEALNSSVEVKGCIATAGCRLMARFSAIGAISMEEKCLHQPHVQARKAASGATWFPISVWWLGLLQSLVLFSEKVLLPLGPRPPY
ncbi:testis-expressed protein 101 [Octodon degus]|uniref:Testis-expressed protein 101 n=1 Tax=Octodon degus TaxID=10160 RepID=A0A6P3FEZ1_OCTDE|nr:testis-expressed protein 101 [Octodon degus]